MKALFSEDRSGPLWVWDWATSSDQYVIGVDFAEHKIRDVAVQRRTPGALQHTSRDRPDYTAAIVVNVETGQHVASWRGYVDPAEFCATLYAMGREYNDALIVPELNHPGYGAVNDLVQVLRYPNVYVNKLFNRADPEQFHGSEFGWRTTQFSKGLLIQRIHQWLGSCGLTRDVRLVNELRTMQHDESGNPRAKGRDKDDMVMALGLALQGRHELLFGHVDKPKPAKPAPGLTERIWTRVKQEFGRDRSSSRDFGGLRRVPRWPGGAGGGGRAGPGGGIS